MRVLMDETPCPLEASTVTEVVAAAGAIAQARGRLIVEVEVDGQRCSVQELEELDQRPAPVDEVRLLTAEPVALAVQALHDAADALTGIDDTQRRAAELIDADEAPKAMELLAEALETWRGVQQAISLVAQLVGVGLDELERAGVPVSSCIRRLGEQLRRVEEALRNRDPVGISDALQYEFPVVIQEWRDLLTCVRGALESGIATTDGAGPGGREEAERTWR